MPWRASWHLDVDGVVAHHFPDGPKGPPRCWTPGLALPLAGVRVVPGTPGVILCSACAAAMAV